MCPAASATFLRTVGLSGYSANKSRAIGQKPGLPPVKQDERNSPQLASFRANWCRNCRSSSRFKTSGMCQEIRQATRGDDAPTLKMRETLHNSHLFVQIGVGIVDLPQDSRRRECARRSAKLRGAMTLPL